MKRSIWLIPLMLVLFIGTAQARILKYQDIVQDAYGRKTSNASVHVYVKGTSTHAPLYSSDSGGTKSNPVLSDDSGLFWFYIDEGRYDITAAKTGFHSQIRTDVWMFAGMDMSLLTFANLSGYISDNASLMAMFNLYALADSGMLSNATLINPRISGVMYSGITGTTQCWELDAAGVPHGTGAPCGAGGGGGGGMTNPMTSINSLIIGGSGGTPTELPIGTQGYLLGSGVSGLGYLSPTTVKTYLNILQSDISGLASTLNSKADVNSPNLVGSPNTVTPSIDNNSTRIANTSWVLGQLSNSNPNMNGTATSGTSLRFMRADARAPSDTSRLPVINPMYQGTMTSPITGSTQNVCVNSSGQFYGSGIACGGGGTNPNGVGVPYWDGGSYGASLSVGNWVNNLVQLNSNAEFPSISGVNLFGIPQSGVTGLTTELSAKIVGPGSSADGELMVFSGSTGTLAKRSGLGTGIVKTLANAKPTIASYLTDTSYLTPYGSAAQLTNFPVMPILSGGTGTTFPNVSIGDIPVIASLTPTAFGVISKGTSSMAILGKNGSGVIGWYTSLSMNAPFVMGTSSAPTNTGFVYLKTDINTVTRGTGTTTVTMMESQGTPTAGYVPVANGVGQPHYYTPLTGGGNVSNSGTPSNHQWSVWTNATTIKGVTVADGVVCSVSGEPALCTNLTDTNKVSDTAYDATSWDGITTVAPSKNSVRDKIESLFTAPNIGAATGTSLIVTGVIDGLTSVVTTTLTTVPVESPERMSIYIYNNPTTPGASVAFTLPSASVAGKGRCYANETGVTSSMTFNTSGAGQYIGVNGVNTASGGYITMSGALGNSICFTSKDSTHWKAWVAHGSDPSVH